MASAVMPYQKDITNQSHHMTMDKVSDSTHLMHDTDHSGSAPESTSSGCVDADCYCPMGGCASAMLPTTPYKNAIPLNSFQKNSQSLLLVTSQIPSSLYRPPISR